MVGGAASVSVSDVEALGLCSVTFGEKGAAVSRAGGTASCFASDVVVSARCSVIIDDEADATSLSSENGLMVEDVRWDMLDCCAISSG